MNDSTTTHNTAKRYSPRAFLAAIGMLLGMRQIWKPIQETVHIPQKTLKHTPQDKLKDAFITILAGAHGMVEVEKRLRNDPVLQRAFGREGCAEQSGIQDTLDVCTDKNVTQMQQALTDLYRQHSGGYAAARAYYEESLVIYRESGFRFRIAESLEALAELAVTERKPEQAAALWGAAEALREEIGLPLPPNQRKAYNRAVAEVRQALGEATFSAAWANGRAMPLEQAMDYATQ